MTETVLLLDPRGGEPFIATIPAGAQRHNVPDRNGINPAIRGSIFERTDGSDRILDLPLFRKKARQL